MTRVLQRWWPLRFGKPAKPLVQLTAAQLKKQTYQSIFVLGLGLSVGLWAVIAFQLPRDDDRFQVGHPSPYSVVAPYSKVFESKVLTEEKRSQAESNDANVVRLRDLGVPQQQRAELSQLLLTISNVRDDPSLSFQARREKLTTLPSASVVLSATLADSILSLDADDWNSVRTQSVFLYDRAIAEYSYELDETNVAELREHSLADWVAGLQSPQRELALFFSSSFLRANSTVDLEATEKRKRAAADAIKPVQVSIQQGESIVRQGDPVRPDTLEKLQEIGAIQPRLNWMVVAGRGILAVLLAGIFSFYVLLFQPLIAGQRRPLAVIGGLLLLTALAARLLLPLWSDWSYAFPLATMVLVMMVLFNGQIALVSAAVLSIVIGFLGDNVMSLAVTMFVGSAVATFVVRRAERSLTYVLAGVAVAAVTALTQIGFWIQNTNSNNWEELLPILLFSGMNGLLSTILSLGLFNLVGRVAGIVTPMQLMELAHPSQRLLRKLIHEAPGTYYHSVAVGNLAESAAEAIGADALLLRVGAYYHDIGKTIRPYFFTDNQTDRENVHDFREAVILDRARYPDAGRFGRGYGALQSPKR